MTSPFDNLTGHGKPLKAEPADARELAGLCRSGLARLEDVANAGLSREGRFDLAYNAAHALSLAALRRQGYRSSNRYIVFQLLPRTLGLGPEVWRVLANRLGLRGWARTAHEAQQGRCGSDVGEYCSPSTTGNFRR